MQVHELKAPRGSRKSKRILGRGNGSGRGKTAGRGENGQRSRSGRWATKGSEGGQMALIRRLPKVGFRNQNATVYQVVNVGQLSIFEKDTVVTVDLLKQKGLVRSRRKLVKILGNGELTQPVVVQVHNVSKTAQEKITKAGGKIEDIPVQSIDKEDKA